MKNSYFYRCKTPILLACIFLFALTLQATAWELRSASGGKYGLEIDVQFPEEPDNVERWKEAFNKAGGQVYKATQGQVFLEKVNFYYCAYEINGKVSNSNADVLVFLGEGGSETVFAGDSFRGQVLMYEASVFDGLGESLGHELIHLFFNTRDEYSAPRQVQTSVFSVSAVGGVEKFVKMLESQNPGKRVAVSTRQEVKSLVSQFGGGDADYAIFCEEQPHKSPKACIMASDARRSREGLIDYYDGLCGPNHVFSTVIVDESKQQIYVTKAGQSLVHPTESCQQTATRVFQKNHGHTLQFSETAGEVAPRLVGAFEEFDECDDVVVLVLDKSGSMSGARIANVMASAARLIDSLNNDTKLGIVWFDSQPRVAVGISDLENSRGLAKQAVFGVSASGGTEIAKALGVAHTQIQLFRSPFNDHEETIFLLTDGESSDDPTAITNILASEGVKINTVGLGQNADNIGLQEMARTTGGRAFFAANDEDIDRIVTQGATESLEGYALLARFDDTPLSGDFTFEVDGYVENILLQQEIRNIDTSLMQESSFSVLDESGNSVNANVRFSALDANRASVVVVIEGALSRKYTLRIDPTILKTDSTLSALVLGQSSKLRFSADADTGNESGGAVTSPNGVLLRGWLVSDQGTASELSVKAIVTRPDDSKIEVKLYDDGSPVHGDDTANDGVYSHRFFQYNGNGSYSVEFIADNSAGDAVAGRSYHNQNFSPRETKFAPFVRVTTSQFQVSGYTAPAAATLSLEGFQLELPEIEVDNFLPSVGGIVFGSFKAVSGPDQPVLVEKMELKFSSESADSLKYLEFVEFYVDADGDGAIDTAPDTAGPIARVKVAEASAGSVVLENVFTLEPNSDLNILVTGTFILPQDERKEIVLEAGAGVISLFVILLMAPRTRRLAAYTALGLCAVVVIGCGSEARNFVFDNGSTANGGQVAQVEIPASFALDLSTVQARGLIDGTVITVAVTGETTGAPAKISIPENLVGTQGG